jgi:hypothetical protein
MPISIPVGDVTEPRPGVFVATCGPCAYKSVDMPSQSKANFALKQHRCGDNHRRNVRGALDKEYT